VIPIRLEDCGDQLDVKTYSAWCLQSTGTTYRQLHDGTCLVPPFTLKPSPRWRRDDCQAAMARRDLVAQQRKERVKKQLAKAS
jgi:hypothetical protein